MEPDDHVCLCFHVTKRKVVNFIRVEKPRRVSQISDCLGAGTGCGWCRPMLSRFYCEWAEQQPEERGDTSDSPAWESLTAQEYAAQRRAYRSRKAKTDGQNEDLA